ncbi:glucagon-like peptide 2 receptor [Aulostomus maculatus]
MEAAPRSEGCQLIEDGVGPMSLDSLLEGYQALTPVQVWFPVFMRKLLILDAGALIPSVIPALIPTVISERSPQTCCGQKRLQNLTMGDCEDCVTLVRQPCWAQEQETVVGVESISRDTVGERIKGEPSSSSRRVSAIALRSTKPTAADTLPSYSHSSLASECRRNPGMLPKVVQRRKTGEPGHRYLGFPDAPLGAGPVWISVPDTTGRLQRQGQLFQQHKGDLNRIGIRISLPFLISFLSVSTRKVTCSVLESLIAKRTEYWDACNRTLTSSSLSGTAGIYCNGTFDTFVCWPHSPPGNVSVPCPPYLPWITEDGARRAHRECLENGRWRRRENSSEPWRDDSECQGEHYFKDKEDELLRQTALRLISVVGYSLSLCSLVLATLLMSVLRKLHCTRNYIHMNLFVSFILRAVAVISKEIVLYIMYSDLPKDDPGWTAYSGSMTAIMCKFSKVAMEYFVACNYFWLLVEAVFLHTLLFTAVLTKRRLLKKYMLLGWGTPLLFVTPWTVVKILYENTECWSIVNRWFWWIIRGPITLSVLVIFFIFIKILMLLLSKLKADQVKFTDYRYSLARATLVLIPLLGIHEVVFTVLIDECMEGSSRYARNFINLTLSSFQGFLVAVLYCFANGEVQAELKKRWQLFLFTNNIQIRTCFRGAPLKHLWKCTRGRHPQCQQSESYDDAGASTMNPHLLQVAVHGAVGVHGLREVKGQGLKGCEAAGLDFLTRKSLSSSDGEMTLGETMEEILEESEF